MVGSAITNFAIGVWLFTETGNATPIVLTAFFTWLPPAFLNSFAGVFVLRTPYLLSLVDDEKVLGVLLTIASVGLVGGGLITMVWQGTEQRIHTIMPALALGAVTMILYGLVRTPLVLAIVGFVMMLPYKLSNALLSTVMQSKVPPDMQGRVFSFTSQLSLFALPLTYLLTGPLIDNVLEPAVGGTYWHWVEPLVGSSPGAGMGLYIVVCGTIWLVGTLLVYALPIVRHMEKRLPNYRAVVAEAAGGA